MAVYIRSIIKDLSITYQVLNKTAVSDGELNTGLVLGLIFGILMLPSVFADHSEVTITQAPISGTPRCEVTVEGCYFPKEATVDVGGKVTFLNTDTVAHTFTAGDGTNGPSGEFDSSLVLSGSSYEWIPTAAGEIPYFCVVHPWMTGLIIVQERVPIKDIDNDGINDKTDQCPIQSETFNEYHDTDGCPDIIPMDSPMPTIDAEHEATQILTDFRSDSLSIIEFSNDDLSIIPKSMIEFVEKNKDQFNPELIHSVSTMEYGLATDAIDIILDDAGLKGQFYSTVSSKFKEVFKNNLQQLDDLYEQSVNKIKNLDLAEPKKEYYLRELDKGKELMKSTQLAAATTILQPMEEKIRNSKDTESIRSELEKPSQPVGGGGCLIATAAYGSELAPQVQQLRELRDNSLLQTVSGTVFMSSFNNFYYSFSPTIADWERENTVFKEFVKITLTPMISSLSILNYVEINSESSVLVYGIGIILLNLGMYLVIPALVIIKTKEKLTSLHTKI